LVFRHTREISNLEAVLVLKLLDSLNVVLVGATGNDGVADPLVKSCPTLFKPEGSLPNIVAVGATTYAGGLWQASQALMADMVFAPGAQVRVGDGEGSAASGTSFGKFRQNRRVELLPNIIGLGLRLETDCLNTAAPAIAGLLAYFRALPGNDFTDPAKMNTLLKKMSRPIVNGGNIREPDNLRAQVWNGQIRVEGLQGSVTDISCLSAFTADAKCPPIYLHDPTPVGDLCPIPGVSKRSLQGNEFGDTISITTIVARQASCPIQPGGTGPESPGGDESAPTKTITWTRYVLTMTHTTPNCPDSLVFSSSHSQVQC